MALVGGAAADETWVGFTNDRPFSEARIEVGRTGANTVEFDLVIPGVAVENVATEAGAFTRLNVPGLGQIGRPGEPLLPALRRFVEIPLGATAEVSATVLDRATVELAAENLAALLYPVQLPMPKCACPEADAWRFSFQPSAYQGAIDRGAPRISGPFTLRDHRMIMVTASPAAYDPAAGTVEIATRTRVTVTISGGDAAATARVKERLSSRQFDAFLADAAVNLNLTEAAGWAYPDDAPVEFLIITPPQFVTDLTPFVEWKTSTGYHVSVVTTDVTGTTTAAIKSHITGLYNGPNPPVYILMIGDSPTPLATWSQTPGGGGGTDLPYVQMDGDLYPDLMIARWPIDDSTELANMRDKILFYEQPTAANSAWLNRALFLAGDDYIPNGVTTHEEVIAQLMQPAPNSAECELWYGDTQNPTTQQLIDDLNSGRGWAVYSAHSGPSGWSGDPPLSSTDMPNFGNSNMYSIAHGHSCSSNEWYNYADVFGEAAVTQPSKGFVSYWGGSASTYWDEDDWLEKGFFDSMFGTDMAGNLITLDGQYSNIAACYSGLTEVTLRGGNEEYYWRCYNLNGDPTLDPFTRAPIAVTVGAPPVVPPVADTFTVTVSDGAIGPVALAMVGVTQNGTLLGAGLTDATGTAAFPIDAPSPGSNLLVRVTAHNHLPTDATTMVAAGSDGVVVFDRTVYRCDSSVAIDVFDEDLDGDPPFDVFLSSPSGGSVPVEVSSVGVGVVQFHGTAVLGSDLTVSHGEVLTVTYNDADTGSGSPAAKIDTATLDCAGPAISNVQAVATESSVTFSFTTDEPGTTVVAYGQTTPPSTILSDGIPAIDHVITAEGVPPCTTFFFEVRSVDALGNLGSDTNGGAYFQVETAGWGVFLSESFDSDPGWAIDNGGFPATGWAFGQPTGQGQDGYGGPDPTAGFTGPNVYGVNLQGDIPASLGDNELKLTTPVIDLSTATSVQLRFRRWLGVEQDTYDNARIRLSTDGGASWQTVWENDGTTIDDQAWIEQVVALPQAVGQSQVQISWTYGATDSSWNYCGWNIDDVVIEGAMPCDGLNALFEDDFETGDCGNWSLAVGEQ
jgi:hypothetical protein